MQRYMDALHDKLESLATRLDQGLGVRLRVGGVAYTGEGEAQRVRTSPLQQGHRGFERFIEGITASGISPDALPEALAQCAGLEWDDGIGRSIRRCVVILTNGHAAAGPGTPRKNLPEAVVLRMSDRRIATHTVSCGLTGSDRAWHERLCGPTGGNCADASPEHLEAVLLQILTGGDWPEAEEPWFHGALTPHAHASLDGPVAPHAPQ
eukprot:TRINITY_DN28310_c0_g1_i1.p1 TRINITY_DN28310_c0_g1~~TRINITY_DN28310_c0_g1_i1.p1  ORF type:complete len:208 (+),score=35.60 TRINITY_DN28310_c0_g1_i1:202-825(+)